ncbi:MAG: hypothetical protein ABSC03_18390 [Verrucomicrobiota bacterium]|jgi:hypothetical protein
MTRRLFLPLTALFWVVMNVLLWRSEMSGRGNAGSAVPPTLVWERILTAPDDSSLQVLLDGHKIGYCRWAATVGEAPVAGRPVDPATEPEGRVRRLASYTLEFDGNVVLADPPQRFRFDTRAEFGADRAWRKASLKLFTRNQPIEVRADAKAASVTFSLGRESATWTRTYTFDELGRPETLLADFGLAGGLAWLGPLAQGLSGAAPANLSLALPWEAHLEWLKLGGGARTRVFRLETRVLDKYRAVVIVSRVGEILRVELPGDVVLVNEAIASL